MIVNKNLKLTDSSYRVLFKDFAAFEEFEVDGSIL